MGRFLGLALRFIPRLPLYSRLAPFLELDRLSSLNPWVLLGSLGLPALLGLYSSPLGHIDTTPYIYQIMPIISGINPALGMLAGLLFGVADMAEKMLTNNIYGSAVLGDYVGARLGYVFAYSGVILSGMLPGVLSRVFRQAAKRLIGGAVSPPPGVLRFAATGDPKMMELIAGALGGAIGGAFANAAAIALELPAFMLRVNPDYSCYAAAVNNLINGIPLSGVAGGVGGAVPPGASVGPVIPEVPTPDQQDEMRRRRCQELRGQIDDVITAYRRYDNIIGQVLPVIQEAQKLMGAQRAILQAEALIKAAEAYYDYCATKQAVYWGLFGWWAEGIPNLVPRFFMWSGIGLGFVGALGSVQGEKVAAALTRLGVSTTRIQTIAGAASMTGAVVVGTMGAATSLGPPARDALADMLNQIHEARSVLWDFKLKVSLVLEKVKEIQAKYGTEPITKLDQMERRSKIAPLQVDMDVLQCPDKPDTSALPPVRGLDLGWQERPLG